MFLVLLACAMLIVFNCICVCFYFLIYAVNDSHCAAEDITDVLKDIHDSHGSLQLSVTQSQSVDRTEPVTQAEDVPMQLQLEDERKRKKKSEFLRKKELERRKQVACVQ